MTRARVPRLVPDEPFPPYSFVPGRSPHPRSDPAGHSFGVEAGAVTPLDPGRWPASRAYLYGIDLFSHDFYWEAHEVWEGLWHAAGRKGLLADFLKGLIKLAAAGVKHLEGRPKGVHSHACRAAELWRGVDRGLNTAGEPFCGLRLTELIERADAVCREGWPEEPPRLLPTLPRQ
jgi:hypothetical protein